jgi:hypothetical protein
MYVNEFISHSARLHSRSFWVYKGCTYLVLNESGYKLVHPGMQRVYTFAFVHPLYTLARRHNVFVLSNSRDHRFSHPSPTFKNERKNFLLPSILSLFTFTSIESHHLILASFTFRNSKLSKDSFNSAVKLYLLIRESKPEP